jgi:Icc-related predicted phosphoesterase
VFLTHAPPEGIHDAADLCHRGFRCYRAFMKRFRPALLVHGHIHIYDQNTARSTLFGATTVLNAYNHCTYDLEVPL